MVSIDLDTQMNTLVRHIFQQNVLIVKQISHK